jgi:hypothetical protein
MEQNVEFLDSDWSRTAPEKTLGSLKRAYKAELAAGDSVEKEKR